MKIESKVNLQIVELKKKDPYHIKQALFWCEKMAKRQRNWKELAVKQNLSKCETEIGQFLNGKSLGLLMLPALSQFLTKVMVHFPIFNNDNLLKGALTYKLMRNSISNYNY